MKSGRPGERGAERDGGLGIGFSKVFLRLIVFTIVFFLFFCVWCCFSNDLCFLALLEGFLGMFLLAS